MGGETVPVSCDRQAHTDRQTDETPPHETW